MHSNHLCTTHGLYSRNANERSSTLYRTQRSEKQYKLTNSPPTAPHSFIQTTDHGVSQASARTVSWSRTCMCEARDNNLPMPCNSLSPIRCMRSASCPQIDDPRPYSEPSANVFVNTPTGSTQAEQGTRTRTFDHLVIVFPPK